MAGRAQFGQLVFTRSRLKLSQIYTPAIDHDATKRNGSSYRSHWMLLPRSGSLLCKSAPLPFLRTALSRHWVAPTERQTSPAQPTSGNTSIPRAQRMAGLANRQCGTEILAQSPLRAVCNKDPLHRNHVRPIHWNERNSHNALATPKHVANRVGHFRRIENVVPLMGLKRQSI